MYGAEPVGLCAVVPCGSATAPVFCEISTSVFGAVDEIPIFPSGKIQTCSDINETVSTPKTSAPEFPEVPIFLMPIKALPTDGLLGQYDIFSIRSIIVGSFFTRK